MQNVSKAINKNYQNKFCILFANFFSNTARLIFWGKFFNPNKIYSDLQINYSQLHFNGFSFAKEDWKHRDKMKFHPQTNLCRELDEWDYTED